MGLSIDKSKKYLPYDQAKLLIREFLFNNRESYFKYVRSENPENLPPRPDLFYGNWESWGIFLNNGNICTREIIFPSIVEIKEIIKENNIKSRREWGKFSKNSSTLPSNLRGTYGKSHFYFFGGVSNIPSAKMSGFFLDVKIVEYLLEYYNISSYKDWNNLRKIYVRLPASPSHYNLKFNQTFLTYCECKSFLLKLKIDSIYKWFDFIKSKPKNVPRHPDDFYEDWESWKDFLNIKVSKSSIGENNIEEYLIASDIKYEKEKTFEGCRNINKLRFDFYCPFENLCIEFDGKQHFTPIDYFGGVEYFEILKKRDIIKNEYCNQNDINLLRIRYDEVNDISDLIRDYLIYKSIKIIN